MTITLDPFNDCDCCGYGSDIHFGAPSVPLITINCLTNVKCNPVQVPRYWEVVVPALTKICTGTDNCFRWGGTFIMEHAATAGVSGIDIGGRSPACCWVTPRLSPQPTVNGGSFGAFCQTGSATFFFCIGATLNSQVSFFYQTFLAGLVRATYTILATDFDCNGPNTFPLISSGTGNACTGFPSTVTIEPAFGP